MPHKVINKAAAKQKVSSMDDITQEMLSLMQEPMGQIPEDVVEYGVLPCFPAKALMRLQLVSRRWRSLILEDPYFARLQVVRARSFSALLLSTEWVNPKVYTANPKLVGFPKLSKQFYDQRYCYPPKIVASCKGILCISPISGNNQGAQLYVGNPVLKDWITHPLPFADNKVGIGLAVYEMESGVGYKLIVPFGSLNNEGLVAEAGFKVLASTKGSWEISQEKVQMNNCRGWLDSYAINVEGTLFWKQSGKVIWFDVKEERCGSFSWPRQFMYCRNESLGEWNGRLSFMTTINGEISIWSWNHLDWSWRQLLTIEAFVRENFDFFSSIGIRMNLSSQKYEPFEAIPQRIRVQVIAFAANFIIFNVNGKRICYDVITGKAQEVSSKHWIDGKSVFPYVNSLLKLTHSSVAE